MILTAELPLVVAAIALALVALLVTTPLLEVERRRIVAIGVAFIGVVAPLALFAARDGTRETGRALWEWSAAGGPTIQAAYRYDGLAALGVSATVAVGSAGLLAISRAAIRRPLLPSLVLAVAFVSIALDVTEDLVAAIVVLGAIGASTAFLTLLVAPPPVAARLATFLAIGVQLFVLAVLLVGRFGGASFSFDAIQPTWISPGVVAAGSVAAALFAGLYPFVPWRFERPAAGASEREALRGLLAMPAGIGATLVLLRLLGTTRGDLSELGVPGIDPAGRTVALLAIAAIVATRGRALRRIPRGGIALAAIAALALLVYPLLHWSHIVLAAVFLTVLYAAAVSLARPDDWEVVRFDVALAGAWTGLAIGTPISIAAGVALLLAESVAALAESIWLAPHLSQIALVVTASAGGTALLTLGVGILAAPDAGTRLLASIVLLSLLLLELVHIGRRLGITFVPPELDVTAAASAFLLSLLGAMLVAAPLVAALAEIDRAIALDASAPLQVAAIAASSTVLVLLARAVRPLVPDLTPVAVRLHDLVTALDPVPAGVAAFRAVDRTTTAASAAFTLFERRAGVWLATSLIVALLFWATRP